MENEQIKNMKDKVSKAKFRCDKCGKHYYGFDLLQANITLLGYEVGEGLTSCFSCSPHSEKISITNYLIGDKNGK